MRKIIAALAVALVSGGALAQEAQPATAPAEEPAATGVAEAGAKIDEILKRVAPREGEAIINELDEAYAGRHTDPHYQQRAERRE